MKVYAWLSMKTKAELIQMMISHKDIKLCQSVSGRPMVVSTGMQSMETIQRVYKTVKEYNQNFTLLQCTSAYPLDPKDVNLSVIKVR